jgi:hypothetical protein
VKAHNWYPLVCSLCKSYGWEPVNRWNDKRKDYRRISFSDKMSKRLYPEQRDAILRSIKTMLKREGIEYNKAYWHEAEGEYGGWYHAKYDKLVIEVPLS